MINAQYSPRPILTPADHATALHPGPDWLRVVIAWFEGDKFRQWSVPISDLAYVSRFLGGHVDHYLSVGGFRGIRRRIVDLVQLDALFTDLDYRKIPGLADLRPWQVCELYFEALRDAGIPLPSLVIFSGGGLYAIWLHSMIPRAAISRWNACQKRIWQVGVPFGADQQARDAARVLRLVGTVNSKYGNTVQAITELGPRYQFDALADEILPMQRADLAQLYDLSVRRASVRRQIRHVKGVGLEGFNDATLWEARLSDLQTWREMHWFGYLPEGQRNAWMLLATTAASWITIPSMLSREAYALAREATGPAGWGTTETDRCITSVVQRAIQAANGEPTYWNGKAYDPRYWYKNESIIELLGITADEQRQLRTIWSDDVRREKEREQWRATHTGMDRAAYLEQATATDKRAEALRLKAEGVNVSEIARQLGISRQRVQQYFKGGARGTPVV